MSSKSPSPHSRPSGRKGNRKVRTGCITCKVRKVKCDEAKPACLRCVKTGRRCDGYVVRRPSAESTSLLRLSPTMEFESPEGCRAFEYYRSHSAPILGNIMDSEFWGGLVMRLSVTEPVVRHAVLALSRLHEHLSISNDDHSAPSPAFVFEEYGKSIDSLKKWRDGPVVPLLACVLFVCIEFLLDNEDATKIHIFQGRQLLCTIADEAPHTRDMVKRELVPMYTRLGLAAFLYGVQPPCVPEILRLPLVPPAKYENIAHARMHLYHILDQALRFSTSSKAKLYGAAIDPHEMQQLEAEQRLILSHLGQWDAAFAVLNSSSKMNQTSISVRSLLQMYHSAAFIWTSTALNTQELAYDAHTSSFASIVSNAASIINASHRGSRIHAFSFETELVAPMYWTVIKCRHPLLRRAALRLLMRDELKGRRENLWHAQEAITISSRAIQVEELQMTPARTDDVEDAMSGFSDETGHSTPGSLASSGLSFKSSLFAPTSRPPTTTAECSTEPLDWDSFSEDTRTNLFGSDDELYDSIAAPIPDVDMGNIDDNTRNVPPFGIDEAQRIKNILIGPRKAGGVWITTFRDPVHGESQWDVRKEFLSFYQE